MQSRGRIASPWARTVLALDLSVALAAVIASRPGRAHADERERCASASERAQDLRSAGKLRAARASLLTCVSATCPAVVRLDCLKWLPEVDAILPSVIIRATDPNGKDLIAVRVLVDGEVIADGLDGKAIPLDPGPHRIRYETAGAIPVEDTVLIRESEKDRVLAVRLAPGTPGASPPGSALAPVTATPGPRVATTPESLPGGPATSSSATSSPAWPIVPTALAAVGVAGLATFAYLGIAGQSDYDRCNQLPAVCTSSDISGLAARRDIAWIAGGVGLASLGAATWLFFSRPRATPSVAVRAACSTHGATLELSGHY